MLCHTGSGITVLFDSFDFVASGHPTKEKMRIKASNRGSGLQLAKVGNGGG
jgi:hypothetical protein